MAKRGIRSYRLIANSRFRPMTYDEILSPALMQTQAHQALEAQYADLASKANELEKKLDANRDKVSRATYEKYMSDLDSIATKLTKFGLTQGSNRDALAANSEYHKRIIPIIEGYNRRAEAERQQQAMLAQDPTRLFNRLASELSVDDFVADQTLDVISQNYSGAMITKQVADQAVGVIRWAKKNGGLHSLGIPYKYEQEFQTAYSPEEVYNTMHNMMKDPEAVPFLKQVVNQVMQSTGISKWSSVNGDENSYNWKRGMNYALEGLPAFIGTRTWKVYDDNYNMQLGLLKQRQSGSGSGTDYQYRGMQSNPNYLYSTDGLSNVRQWANNGFFEKGKDGKYHITAKGIGNLVSSKPVTTGGAGGAHAAAANAQYAKPSDFADFISRTQGRDIRGLKREEIDALLNDALNDYEDFADADAYREVVHDLYLNPAQQAAWKDRLGEKRLSRAEYIGKGKGYRTGSAANPNELDDIDWKTVTPTRIRTSRYGNTILLQDKEGNKFEYMLPTNVNQTFEQPIAKSIKDYYDLSDLASSGRKPVYERDNNGRVIGFKRGDDGRYLTEDREASANETAAIYAAADNAYMPANAYFMNIGATWGVRPSESQYGIFPTDIYNSVSPWTMWQGLAGDNDNEEE